MARGVVEVKAIVDSVEENGSVERLVLGRTVEPDSTRTSQLSEIDADSTDPEVF
jgi:hypothetical protein